MALKITCPHCGTPHHLKEPFPVPGSERHCSCGRTLAITYPQGLVTQLKQRGATFRDPLGDEDSTEVFLHPTGGSLNTAPQDRAPPPPTVPRPQPPTESQKPTTLDHQGPHGVKETEATAQATQPLPPPPAARTVSPKKVDSRKAPAQPQPSDTVRINTAPPPRGKPRARRSWAKRLALAAVLLVGFGGLAGGAAAVGVVWHFSQDLPTFEALADYTPPSVTTIYDRQGRLMGEIYEKRRYVRPIEDFPEHTLDAFIAAEDANFWNHPGVDAEGILRAIVRNAMKGKKAQGASTITQQVARNFLLSSEKKYSRKIKEMILATRMEKIFSKEHILYLYVNQIYLGSGAYGVEAAARTYFDKNAEELTLAESAIIAGLPQRPSDYSPHRHWDKARARQEYVLGQMVAKGFISQAQYDTALAEQVQIHERPNEFLQAAPYFTEHIRRYLVDTYGFDKIYNDGLRVDATCDLDLQKAAQEALRSGVTLADNRTGWRGATQTLEDDAIAKWRADQEQTLREEAQKSRLVVAEQTEEGAGYAPIPERSSLEAQRRYEAVVLEVEPKHAVVGIGAHKAIIGLSTTKWAYKPNPERSWKRRALQSMSDALAPGDLVEVVLEHPDARELERFQGYSGLPEGDIAGATLYQDPTLQGALYSYRLEDGAVLAMVGGVDFENSEYNRATQARRQVGSTFKPVVYAAAIQSKVFTAGSLVQDAPTVFNVLDEKLWKPGNYGNEYLGNITLRRALQLSRNVVTIRVLDKIGLEPVFELGGPTLGIGYAQPSCSRTHTPVDTPCKGTSSPSPVEGMQWCEFCDPSPCPLTLVDNPFEEITCLDDPTTVDGIDYCRSCDVNLRLCDWLEVDRIPEGENCLDQRIDDQGQIWCRSCDLSMGLGSSSLTMVELAKAYSVFATYGTLVEPHTIDRVVDRDGTIIESYEPGEWPRVMDPSVAGIAHWLLRQVATGGTAAKTNRLGLQVAGKTGTTNDFMDAWFVGYNPDVITASWVGYDTPRSMGYSFTGGDTALPIWMDYMRVAVPKDKDRRFPEIKGIDMIPIDESTGLVARGGRPMPMLKGTAPTNVVGEVGQKSTEDLLTSDF